MIDHHETTSPKPSYGSSIEEGSEGQRSLKPIFKATAVRVLSPGLISTFSGKMESPMPGVFSLLARSRRLFKKRMEGGKGFKSVEEVLADNPDFEEVRKIAMRRLRAGAQLSLVFVVGTLLWEMVVGFSVWPDQFRAFNSLMPFMIGAVSLAYFFSNDFRYVVFKHRLIRLTFRQYIMLRIGYGFQSKR